MPCHSASHPLWLACPHHDDHLLVSLSQTQYLLPVTLLPPLVTPLSIRTTFNLLFQSCESEDNSPKFCCTISAVKVSVSNHPNNRNALLRQPIRHPHSDQCAPVLQTPLPGHGRAQGMAERAQAPHLTQLAPREDRIQAPSFLEGAPAGKHLLTDPIPAPDLKATWRIFFQAE